VYPERLFKDLVLLVGMHGIYHSFEKFLGILVVDTPDVKFVVNLPLTVDVAKAKRNELYEQNFHGRGNPWSYKSWNFKKTKKMKRCQPEIGWKACASIFDYLSGTIICSEYSSLIEVWRVLSKNNAFKIFKMINRLDTLSRELICIGKFTVEPPIKYKFTAIPNEEMINAFLATIRVRYDLPIIKGYDHFEFVRKNFKLRQFYSPEQFFIPGLIEDDEDPETIISEMKESSQRKNLKKMELNKNDVSREIKNTSSQSLSALETSVWKRVCPKSHILDPVPNFQHDSKCGVCQNFLEMQSIM